MGVRQILRDFSGWTSAHGIPHIGSAQNLGLRLFWAVIFLFSTGMFTYQMVLLIQKYLKYEVTVQTELKFEERDFPAVTVCNLNPYKMQEVHAVPEMEQLMAAYNRSVYGVASANNRWGLNDFLNDSVSSQSLAATHLMLIASNYQRNQPQLLNVTLYRSDEFIKSCGYNTKPCNMDGDFIQKVDPIYGACFTFNSPTKYKSTRAGPLYGLRMLLKSNQSEYLPVTESAGVRVSVHGSEEEAFVDAFGYNAAAGFTTSFGIKFIRTHRLSRPYGNCTKSDGNGPFFYKGNYSAEGCFRSCFQQNVWDACECFDPRFASPSEDHYCSNDKLHCMQNISAPSSLKKTSSFDLVSHCSCPQPCNESSYGVTVSTALWPSDVYRPPECLVANPPYWTTLTECLSWYSRNTMLVEVYYERMNYQLQTESPAYGMVNLISDLGGQLGLWMGISVITVVEFISLLVLLCLYCMAQREHKLRTKDIGDSDDEDDKKQLPDAKPEPPPPYQKMQ